MRENRTSGSEGGGTNTIASPYPIPNFLFGSNRGLELAKPSAFFHSSPCRQKVSTMLSCYPRSVNRGSVRRAVLRHRKMTLNDNQFKR
jgi:hypothetical protein